MVTEEVEGSVFNPLRVSDNGITGSRETLESDVILPDSRIKSIPETGTESSSGDISTEWNIDEQDDLFAAVMCSEWKDVEIDEDETPNLKTLKELVLDEKRATYTMVKNYKQTPKEYQMFTGLQVNQLALALELNSFAKCTWSFMGNNHPKSIKYEEDELSEVAEFDGMTFADQLATKSFKTLEGSIWFGDSFDDMKQNRQISSFNLTINNNMEATQALFETEAIEQSLGDFQVTGDFAVWKSGDLARELSNEAIDGKDKCFKIIVSREVESQKFSYEIWLKVHLDSSEESKDGNKLSNTINFTMGVVDGIKFVKKVESL